MESVRKAEMTRLQEKVRILTASTEQLNVHLQSSREKELKLEKILIEANVVHSDWTPPTMDLVTHQQSDSDHDNNNSSNNNDNDGVNIKDGFSKLVLTQAQGRARDLQIELDDVRANMDDLILEIEAVSSEERKVADQCTRLLAQMQDSQSMQRGVLEENLRLHHSMGDRYLEDDPVNGRP